MDGSDPATEWNGVLSIDETPGLKNPPNGWLYNTNNWPWSAAGSNSPKKADYPAYVDKNGENPRGIHAIKVLDARKDFTVDSLVATAYDSYQPGFAEQIPALLKAYDEAAGIEPVEGEAVGADRRAQSDGTSAGRRPPSPIRSPCTGAKKSAGVSNADARKAGISADEYIVSKATPDQMVQALAAASDKLAARLRQLENAMG